MRKFTFLVFVSLIAIGCKSAKNFGLKDAFKDKFLIGTALNATQVKVQQPNAMALINRHFNSIVAENCMKSANIQPREGEFDFKQADEFVAFGEKNNMHITGHTLIWHGQCPDWFFKDAQGNNVSPEVLKQRMKTHISTLMGRYKGRVHVWDVVNEAVEDNGELRKSKFLQILGEDYLRYAFEYAREADPGAELCYNDYSMSVPAKRDGVIRMIKKLQSQGVKVDAIGMQEHNSLNYPPIKSSEESIISFAKLGVKVMITELDVSVLPWPGTNHTAEVSSSFEFMEEYNPYSDGLPGNVLQQLNQYYTDYFDMLVKHKDKISRVNFWGLTDRNSWLNNWPVKGRTDYPLLFDRNYQPKAAVDIIISRHARGRKQKN